MKDILRVYLDPAEIGLDGYPYAWHRSTARKPAPGGPCETSGCGGTILSPIKDLVRQRDGHRCLRCHHPYPKRITEKYPRGEWTPCDEQCRHGGPMQYHNPIAPPQPLSDANASRIRDMEEEGARRGYFQAQWRILTVHHLNGIKYDCRWWNLVSLCQRCHLTIQGKVYMERPWVKPHSDWFKPFVAGFYAWKYLDLELTKEETLARLDELLDLELTQEALF